MNNNEREIERRKRGSFMRKKIWTIFLFMMIVLQLSCLTAFAKTTTQKVDLNGDKRKETVKIVEGSSVKVYINGKQMLQAPKYSQVRVVDYNKKDKYREIVVLKDANSRVRCYSVITLYRYNGKKLVQYAQGEGSSRSSNVLAAGHCYCYLDYNDLDWGIDFKGDGYLRVISMFSHRRYSVYSNITMLYKIQNGKFVIDSSKHHYTGDGENDALSKVPCNMNVYQYPRSTSNKKLFTLQKNTRFCIRRIVVNSKQTYVRIKDSKTKKYGWIIFPTKDIQISEPGMY